MGRSKVEKGYLIEFHQIGNAIKVSAIDPKTLTEVSIVGSPNMSEMALKSAAVRKLEYVLNKKDSDRGESGSKKGKGRGLLV